MPSLDRFLDEMAQRLYGRTMTDAIRYRMCIRCATDLTDACSKWSRAEWNEYALLALCPACAEEVVAELDDPDE